MVDEDIVEDMKVETKQTSPEKIKSTTENAENIDMVITTITDSNPVKVQQEPQKQTNNVQLPAAVAAES